MLLTEYNEEETMIMFKRDYEAELDDAKAEAAEAKAAGRIKNTVKKMKEKGHSISDIMDSTGLTAMQIEDI
ncbi:MAG: hypothetical protein Q4E99_05275 [Bacillota bacterium]|nr:hypothetical protein [Bacillota bacterium]